MTRMRNVGKRRREIALSPLIKICLFLALAMVLGACTSSGTPDTAVPDEEAVTTAEPASESEPESSDTTDANSDNAAVVTIGLVTDVINFDPFDTRTGQFSVIRQLYDSLFVFDGDRVLQPEAAESYEIEEEGAAVVVTLRDGMTFHSGTPVTADAVAEVLRYGQEGGGVGGLALVDTWEVLDPLTIRIRFASPVPTMVIEEALDYLPVFEPGVDFTENPAGSGPYVLTDRVPGQSLTMEPYEDHWTYEDGRPQLNFAVFDESATAVAALQTGESDVLYGAPPRDAERLEADGFTVSRGTGPRVVHLQLNPNRPPFDNAMARQAMYHLIPREGIIASALAGQSEPTTLFVPGTPGFAAEDLETYAYDPEKARELFDQSGLTEEQLTDWAILVPANRPNNQALAEVVQAELSAIGLPVPIDLRDTSEASGLIVSGDFAAVSTNASAMYSHPALMEQYRAATTVDNPVLGPDVSAILPDYFEALRAVQTATDADMDEAIVDLRQAIHDGAWMIGCCTVPEGLTVFRDGVTGVRANHKNHLDVRNIAG